MRLRIKSREFYFRGSHFFIIWLSFVFGSYSQTIQSRLITKDGEPIPNAHIYVDKSTGTISNKEGYFSILLPKNQENNTLIISAIGFFSRTISSSQLSSEIVLIENISVLNEVVVEPRDYARELIEKAITAIPRNYPQNNEKHYGFLREQTFWKGDIEPIYIVESALESVKKSYEKKEIKGDVSVREYRKYESSRLDSLSIRIYGGAHHLHRFDIVARRSEFLSNPKDFDFEIQDTLMLDGSNLFKVFFEQKNLDGYVYILDSTFAILKAKLRYKSFHPFDLSNRSRINLNYTVFYQKNNGICRFKNSIYSTAFKRNGKTFELHSEYATTRVSDDFEDIPYAQRIHYGAILLSKNVIYDAEFWKGYNIILPDPKTEKAFEEVGNQRESEEKKKLDFFDIIRKLRTGLTIEYSPIALNPYVISFSNDQINIFQSNNALQTNAISVVSIIQYQLNKNFHLGLNSSTHFSNPSNSTIDLQLIKEINLNPKGRPFFISPGISVGYQQISTSLGNFKSNNDFRISGKTFDSGSTNISLQQRGFRLLPTMAVGIEKSHRIQYFISAGFNIQLNQKTGLHFDETDQFFLKQKKTFLKNGNEGLSINSPDPLFKNTWNLSFGVYLSL